MKKCLFTCFSILVFTPIIWSQSAQILSIRKYSHQHADSILHEYFHFLSLPNIAGDTQNIKKNASFIMDMMQKRGIKNVQLLKATTAGVPPAIYGDVLTPAAKQTIIFYAHYDGQPVNPAQWTKGLEPFQPKLFTNAIDKGGTNIPFPANGNY